MAKKIHVVKPFVLTVAEDQKREFPAGHHTVEDDIADHWYVQAHVGEELPSDAAGDGEAAALKEQLAAAEARADAAEKKAAEAEKARDEALARVAAAEEQLLAALKPAGDDTKGKK